MLGYGRIVGGLSVVFVAWCGGCASAPGIRAATAVFDKNSITIAIPLDEGTWGEPVELDETAGLAYARATQQRPLPKQWPAFEGGVFGVTVPGEFELFDLHGTDDAWRIHFVTRPREDIDDNRNLLLPCFTAPMESPYGFPRSRRAERLAELMRRTFYVTGNVAIDIAADQETILIADTGELFKHFADHHPRQVEVYVTLRGRGVQRTVIPVVYRVDPKQAELPVFFE